MKNAARKYKNENIKKTEEPIKIDQKLTKWTKIDFFIFDFLRPNSYLFRIDFFGNLIYTDQNRFQNLEKSTSLVSQSIRNTFYLKILLHYFSIRLFPGSFTF